MNISSQQSDHQLFSDSVFWFHICMLNSFRIEMLDNRTALYDQQANDLGTITLLNINVYSQVLLLAENCRTFSSIAMTMFSLLKMNHLQQNVPWYLAFFRMSLLECLLPYFNSIYLQINATVLDSNVTLYFSSLFFFNEMNSIFFHEKLFN